MTKRSVFILLAVLLIIAMVLPGCTSEDTSTATTSAGSTTKTTTTASSATKTTTSAATTTAQSNWWDKWGEPTYGGELVYRTGSMNFVTEMQHPTSSQYGACYETLFGDDLLLDRSIHDFTTAFKPTEVMSGWMATGWELKDPTTYVIKLNDNIYWQDKAPTYGRKFVASDVEYSYDRILGIGKFTTPNGIFAPFLPNLEKVAAVDDYTLEFRFKKNSPMNLFEVVGPYLGIVMVPYEFDELTKEEQGDWRNVSGTGAFIIADYQDGVSLTATANPNYWGTDSRNPGNKLPYVDSIKYLCIPDMSTAISALRTEKIDMLTDSRQYPTISQAETIRESIPDINQTWWMTWGPMVAFRYGAEPFDDIKVRQALQLSINREEIASSYYKGYVEGNPVGLLQPQVGEDWVIPYAEWPDDLKAQYVYDPVKAKQLLAEAGYPNGFKTNIISNASDDNTLLLVFKSYFEEIGVEMDITTYETSTHRAMAYDLKYDQMTFDQQFGQASPPISALANYWSGTPRRGRFGEVSDPEFDKLVDKYNAATTMAEAQEAFKEADMYALSQHWVVGGTQVPSAQFWQPYVKGWNGECFWSLWSRMYLARIWMDK